MKLADLKFDTPNNACLSLRIIAEKVRTKELEIEAVVGTLAAKISVSVPTRVETI